MKVILHPRFEMPLETRLDQISSSSALGVPHDRMTTGISRVSDGILRFGILALIFFECGFWSSP